MHLKKILMPQSPSTNYREQQQRNFATFVNLIAQFYYFCYQDKVRI